MNEKLNVVIVDDEILARKLLQDYVSKVDSLISFFAWIIMTALIYRG